MILDRTQAPKIHDAIEFDYVLPPVNTQTLDNGLPLYWLNAGVQEVVEVDWVFPAGLWYEQKEGVAQAVAGLLKNGTSKRNAKEINEALEFYGASVRVKPGNDNATVSLFCMTKHLPQLLPVIFELLTESIFPQEELDIYKQNTIQRLLVSLRECDFVANQQIDALLFGEHHPYGRYTKRAVIETLTREDLQTFHKKSYDLSGVKIFMAGKVSEQDTKCINEVFGKIAVNPTALEVPTFTAETIAERRHHIMNDENGVQGAIRIGSLFPNRHHPDFAPMVVANTLFGGYFGSRLMSNIREDKGYTYGIYSSTTPMLNGGSLIIQTEVGRNVVEAAVKEIYHEMDVICNEKADDDELLLVKNYLLGNLLGDLDGPFHIIQRWRMLILNGLTIEHFNRNVQIYKSITANEVQALAQKYLNKDNFHEVVVI
ncbi:MAG: insulinase family protein [Chitinophagales bacterium]|nr:insulinase family protein [Chitinophagales bacterium]